jgi:hypothetical protein
LFEAPTEILRFVTFASAPSTAAVLTLAHVAPASSLR